MKKLIASLLTLLILTGCGAKTIPADEWQEGAPAGQACDSRYESCVIR